MDLAQPNEMTGYCQHCGGGMIFDSSYAGYSIQCPHCSASTTLPGAPATSWAVSQPLPAPTVVPANVGGVTLACLAVAVVLFLIGLFCMVDLDGSVAFQNKLLAIQREECRAASGELNATRSLYLLGSASYRSVKSSEQNVEASESEIKESEAKIRDTEDRRTHNMLAWFAAGAVFLIIGALTHVRPES